MHKNFRYLSTISVVPWIASCLVVRIVFCNSAPVCSAYNGNCGDCMHTSGCSYCVGKTALQSGTAASDGRCVSTEENVLKDDCVFHIPDYYKGLTCYDVSSAALFSNYQDYIRNVVQETDGLNRGAETVEVGADDNGSDINAPANSADEFVDFYASPDGMINADSLPVSPQKVINYVLILLLVFGILALLCCCATCLCCKNLCCCGCCKTIATWYIHCLLAVCRGAYRSLLFLISAAKNYNKYESAPETSEKKQSYRRKKRLRWESSEIGKTCKSKNNLKKAEESYENEKRKKIRRVSGIAEQITGAPRNGDNLLVYDMKYQNFKHVHERHGHAFIKAENTNAVQNKHKHSRLKSRYSQNLKSLGLPRLSYPGGISEAPETVSNNDQEFFPKLNFLPDYAVSASNRRRSCPSNIYAPGYPQVLMHPY